MEATASEVGPVDGVDGPPGVERGAHLDERYPTGTGCFSVEGDSDADDPPDGGEQAFKFAFRDGVRDVCYEEGRVVGHRVWGLRCPS